MSLIIVLQINRIINTRDVIHDLRATATFETRYLKARITFHAALIPR